MKELNVLTKCSQVCLCTFVLCYCPFLSNFEHVEKLRERKNKKIKKGADKPGEKKKKWDLETHTSGLLKVTGESV